MFYTRSFFAHIAQQKEAAMPRKNGGPVKSEKVAMSESDKEARIRRAVRTLRAGYLVDDLIARGFKDSEIRKAQAMMIGKRR